VTGSTVLSLAALCSPAVPALVIAWGIHREPRLPANDQREAQR
jgi:hypothetical protein